MRALAWLEIFREKSQEGKARMSLGLEEEDEEALFTDLVNRNCEEGSIFSTSSTHRLKCRHRSQCAISSLKGREPDRRAYKITPHE